MDETRTRDLLGPFPMLLVYNTLVAFQWPFPCLFTFLVIGGIQDRGWDGGQSVNSGV